MTLRDDLPPVALVLSGGNALGAFLAGAHEALHRAGIRPAVVCGTSVGAVVGAIIAGNRDEDRLPRLRALWDRAALPSIFAGPRAMRQHVGSITSRMAGVPGIFGHHLPATEGLHDATPLRESLVRLVDFAVLGETGVSFRINAVDAANGEELVFDNHADRIGPDHLLASAAFVPDFPPVEVEGRTLVDGSLARNIMLPPADWLFAEGPRLCIVLDCIDPMTGPPRDFDQLLRCRQELPFAQQARQQLAALMREAELRSAAAKPWRGSLTVLHLFNPAGTDAHSQRQWDYSAETLGERHESGMRVAEDALEWLVDASFPEGAVVLREFRRPVADNA